MDFLDDIPEDKREAAKNYFEGLQSQLDKLNQEKESLSTSKNTILDEKKKLQDKYNGIDVDKYNKIMNDETFQKNKELFEQHGIEGLKEQLKKEIDEQYKGTLSEKDQAYQEALKERDTISQQMEDIKIENDISAAINENAEVLNQGIQRPLKGIIKDEFERDEDGRLVTKDKKMGSDGKRMGLNEWLNKKETMKANPWAFKGKSGAGVNGGEGSGDGTKMSKEQFDAEYSKVPPEQKMAWLEKMEKEGRI